MLLFIIIVGTPCLCMCDCVYEAIIDTQRAHKIKQNQQKTLKIKINKQINALANQRRLLLQ